MSKVRVEFLPLPVSIYFFFKPDISNHRRASTSFRLVPIRSRLLMEFFIGGLNE